MRDGHCAEPLKPLQSVQLKLAWMLLCAPRPVRKILLGLLKKLFSGRLLRKIRTSIRAVLPDLNEAEVDSISRYNLSQSLDQVINILDYDEVSFRLDAYQQGHDLAAKLRNQAAVIASMHMGFADLPSLALNRSGIVCKTLIGRGTSSPVLHYLGQRCLARLKIPYVKRGANTLMELIGCLRNGQSPIIHSDLRDRGYRCCFMGYRTSIPNTAAALAVLANRPLYFCYGQFNPGGICRVRLEQIPFPANYQQMNKQQQINSLSQALLKRMEALIVSQPQDWFWLYRRFKACQRCPRAS
ncbi:MAG: lysophospholipid acyltransferase family protein [Cellvibrionaceae bacterium]|nr:lysophospholipid acyltransferase family protein [Cellvibrionaceae bacterium]